MAEQTYTDHEPSDPQPQPKPSRFVSLRWRILLPVFAVLLVAAMLAAYAITRNLGGGVQVSQSNLLLQSSRAVADHAVDLYDRQRNEAQRAAYTVGIPEAIRTNQTGSLHSMLEGLAAAGGLDSIIITDPSGLEVVGLNRVDTTDFTDYAVSTGTDLSGQPLVRDVLDKGLIDTTGLMRTTEGLLLFSAAPIRFEDELVGIVLVGRRLDGVLTELEGSAVAEVALYGPDGALLATSFKLDEDPQPLLSLDPGIVDQTLESVDRVTSAPPLTIHNVPYQGVYFPFVFGPNVLGVIGTFMPDNVPFATEVVRQVTALVVAGLAGAVVIAAFIGLTRLAIRAEQVTEVAQALAAGQATARTGMQPTSEIEAIGHALDQYAESVGEREDQLRDMLRRKRRESAYLQAVLQALPEGVVVQAEDGRVLLVNDNARGLLGAQRLIDGATLQELTGVVSDVLGPAIVPGIYALGDPRRLDMDGQMMQAQAAAITSPVTDKRVGTVILLRDISEEVRKEQAREEAFSQIAKDIQQPLSTLATVGARSPNELVNAFAREISRHSAILQKMIVDMRELTTLDPAALKRGQRPLSLETLVWAVANDWRQIAQAAGLTLHVIIERKGLFVLGDERRLRWAAGNLIDNAIKYTPANGALTIEIKGEVDGMAHLRVRDNGVGIAPDDLPHIFTRFYRGTPVTREGQIIRVPGMGQGLTDAQQIIAAHGGSIRVKSKQFVGSAAYFSLPLTSGVSMTVRQYEYDDMEGETVKLPADWDMSEL